MAQSADNKVVRIRPVGPPFELAYLLGLSGPGRSGSSEPDTCRVQDIISIRVQKPMMHLTGLAFFYSKINRNIFCLRAGFYLNGAVQRLA